MLVQCIKVDKKIYKNVFCLLYIINFYKTGLGQGRGAKVAKNDS
jgi:hypothetical protein